MKQKTLTIITAMILIIGILGFVSAEEEYAGVLNNISGIHIDNFIAGSTTTASFSYNYLDFYGDKQYPHILRINITSENQTAYPVWKGDFELSGYVKKYYFLGMFHENIGLKCSEEPLLTINHPLGLNTLDVPNGTFYCYNETSKAIDNLDKHDEVYLTISSHPALWPGQYTLSAMIYYLEDTLAPLVNILNKNYFETTYFANGNAFTVEATIDDNVGIKENGYGAIVSTYSEELFRFNGQEQSGFYYFPYSVPTNIPEGNYTLKIFAEDTNGNIGEDNTTLMIDLTGPVINLIQPNGSIYDEIIPIELAVTDEKAGVDNSSVYYRISEIVDGTFCPGTGVIFGNFSCYNSGWISINLNTSGNYEDDFNATLINSGEYWFEAKAKDILGNEGVL